MIFVFTLSIFTAVLLSIVNQSACSAELSSENALDQNSHAPQQMQVFHHDGKFGREYSQVVSDSSLHIWKFIKQFKFHEGFSDGNLEEDLSLNVHVEVDDEATLEYPVMCQVRFGEENLQLTLPMKTDSGRTYRSARRTICAPFFHANNKGGCVNSGHRETDDPPQRNNSQVHVTVSSYSPSQVKFKFTIKLESNIVRFGQKRIAEISSNSPALFKLTKHRDHSSRYALLVINSKDSICTTVSVQSPKCPVLDQENNVNFRGVHHTMSQTAAITIKISELEEGRNLVFVIHEDDSACDSTNQKDRVLPEISKKADKALLKFYAEVVNLQRNKRLEFYLVEKVSDEVYLYSIFGVLLLLVVFCASFSVFYNMYLRPSCTKPQLYSTHSETTVDTDVFRSSNLTDVTAITISTTTVTSEQRRGTNTEEEFDMCCCFFLVSRSRQPFLSEQESQTKSSRLSTSSLHDSCKKCSKDISKSAKRYAGTLFVVAAFYTLPVLQFVLLYQRILDATGNEDLCYHNFRCNHALLGLVAFNHMYSNIGYIILGFYFLGIVYFDERKHSIEDHGFGIHAHYGIYYAMGSALVMQGLLSALYHVCPTHLSYEFDTFFMYVTAVLCLVKIYQARHPDTNASAFVAFSSLAFILAFVLTTILFQRWYFWVLITVVHVILVFVLSVHIYSFGQWKFDCKMNAGPRSFRQRVFSVIFPFRRFDWMTVILALANLSNWFIAGFGISIFYKYGDVSTHFLLIFLINLGLYLAIYVVLKIKNGESVLWPTKFYLIISIPLWTFGLWTFANWPANWELSQAESRTLNTDCVLLDFYDIHDVWHFISAFGMFFMFMFFYTLDNDLRHVKRSNIKVF